jgi:hypothetical protein
MWQSAAELAQSHGIYVVARSLGLDYSTLKKRVKGSAEPSAGRRKKPTLPRPAKDSARTLDGLTC